MKERPGGCWGRSDVFNFVVHFVAHFVGLVLTNRLLQAQIDEVQDEVKVATVRPQGLGRARERLSSIRWSEGLYEE